MTNGERLARRDVKRQQIAFGMRYEIPRRSLPTVRPRISALNPKSGAKEKPDYRFYLLYDKQPHSCDYAIFGLAP
jgi:hypothetical protein